MIGAVIPVSEKYSPMVTVVAAPAAMTKKKEEE